MEIGETWISEYGTEAEIVNITKHTIWCESDFWAFAYPVGKETFLNSMKLKSSAGVSPVIETK
jgi:hypothetical protein